MGALEVGAIIRHVCQAQCGHLSLNSGRRLFQHMTTGHRWTFRVTGALTRNQLEPVRETYEVIVESGVRDAASPYDLRGVGMIARPDAAGRFKTSFVTQGALTPIEPPSSVSVFVRASRGQWQPYVAAVSRDHVQRVSASELVVDVGLVMIGPAQLLYAEETDQPFAPPDVRPPAAPSDERR